MTALDLLTGDAQTFVEKVWARSVHLHRADPDQLVGLLCLDDADALLTSSAIRTPAIRVARDGVVLPEVGFTRNGATIAGTPITGLVDTRRILDQFDQGATVVFQGLHRYWPPLTELVAALETELGHPCQANAYLTPPGAQGFAVHADTHDVFVFQTHGTKQWQIHPVGADGERFREDVLSEPGLAMYLPTGTPHAARAEDGVSLHVTIGINQLTWRSLIRGRVDQLLAAVDDDHLPAGYLQDPSLLAGGLSERLTTLAAGVGALDADLAARGHVADFLSSRSSRLRGALADRLAVRTLTDTTPLRRRPGSRCVLTEAETPQTRATPAIVLLLGDRRITIPAWLRPAIEQVRDTSSSSSSISAPFTPADLPLDPQSRVVLCRRLVREGLLEVLG